MPDARALLDEARRELQAGHAEAATALALRAVLVDRGVRTPADIDMRSLRSLTEEIGLVVPQDDAAATVAWAAMSLSPT
jgi:hypothetical protein